MTWSFAIVIISVGLAAGAYYVTNSGLILKLGAEGTLLTIIGAAVCVASLYVYRPICARKHLVGKERLAFFLSGHLTGAFAGLSAASGAN